MANNEAGYWEWGGNGSYYIKYGGQGMPLHADDI